jgi:hypothetical protein
MFDNFLGDAKAKGISFVPLGELPVINSPLKLSEIVIREISGREGWVCCQSDSSFYQ